MFYFIAKSIGNILTAGASTPYKRWSKCTMEKVGGAFLQKLRGKKGRGEGRGKEKGRGELASRC